MPAEYDPSQEVFSCKESAEPMRAAVEQLARDNGRSLESFEGVTFAEIGRLAAETYDELPEFWSIWQAWHAPQPKPEMGDL